MLPIDAYCLIVQGLCAVFFGKCRLGLGRPHKRTHIILIHLMKGTTIFVYLGGLALCIRWVARQQFGAVVADQVEGTLVTRHDLTIICVMIKHNIYESQDFALGLHF